MRLFLEESCWDAIMSLPRDVQNKFKEFRRKFKENGICKVFSWRI